MTRLATMTLYCPVQPCGPGWYLVASGPRSRAAYLVHGVRAVQHRTKAPVQGWRISVEPVRADCIPAGSQVETFTWLKRNKRRCP